MKVCIDVQSAVSQRAGVGRYVRSLAENMGEFSEDAELSLFFFDFLRKGLLFEASKAEIRAVRWCPGRVMQRAWRSLDWPPYNWFAGPADVYHFPNFVVPPLTSGRSVVTIHDVSFLRMPETTEERNLRYLRSRIADTVKRADAIITDSHFSASEIVELLGVDPGKVHAIYPGISDDFMVPENEEVEAARGTYGLDKPYLLTVGTVEPRKNLRFLMEVFEKMTGFDGHLVVVGAPGWKCEPILERMRSSSRASDIRYLKYVPEDKLRGLYGGAELFVFPSLYEGFGFPPLEAMACGTQVVSSTGGSLREVLDGGALLIEEGDSAEWASRVSGALDDSPSADKGREHAAKYTWREAARKTWAVYEEVQNHQ